MEGFHSQFSLDCSVPELRAEEGHDYSLDDRNDLPYTLVRNLGYGHSANVELVRHRRTGTTYARKVFRIYSKRDERRQTFENEVKVIRRLGAHHHIIRVFAKYIAKREAGILLIPAADGGDLEAFLHDVNERRVVTARDRYILEMAFGCLSSGLSYMHHRKVRHKDIKLGNILIHHGLVVYTDFGYSLHFCARAGCTTFGRPNAITRKYCAPEVSDWAPRNSKSDIYSHGCVFVAVFHVDGEGGEVGSGGR